MKFFFRAKNKEGEIKEGTVDASSKEVALDLIQHSQLFPISIREYRKDNTPLQVLNKYLNRVKVKELMMFFRQLAILVEARVPIIYSLQAIKEQVENSYFRKIINEMMNDVQDGMPFSDAIKKKPEIFSRLSVSIIQSGENSGNFRQSVEYVADNIEKNYNLSRKIASAFIYPAVVMVVFFVVAFIFLAFIIPKMTAVIKGLGVDFPWYTKIIISFSDFMAVFWWVVLLGIIFFILGFIYYLSTQDGKRWSDALKIKMPVFGAIFRGIYLARFTGNLAILLNGDIPIIRAVLLSGSVTNNTVYEDLFERVAYELKIGGSMSKVFEKTELIPPVVAQMIRVGEESGQLPLVLDHVATFYERETDQATKNLSVLLEPLIMIVMGIAVGLLVFSILMPIYDIAGRIT